MHRPTSSVTEAFDIHVTRHVPPMNCYINLIHLHSPPTNATQVDGVKGRVVLMMMDNLLLSLFDGLTAGRINSLELRKSD